MNLRPKYPQILIGSLSSELVLWFLESMKKSNFFQLWTINPELLLKYKPSNEKLYEKIIDKSLKLTDGLHIFDEKLFIHDKIPFFSSF